MIAAFNAALDTLRAAGATVVDNVTLPGLEAVFSSSFELTVLEADFITNLKGYTSKLTRNPNNITDVASLQAFTRSLAPELFPERDTNIWQQSLDLGHGNESPLFWGNLSAQLELAGPQGLTGALANLSLDALAAPTTVSSTIPAMLGAPVITVPLGKLPANTTVERNRFGNLNATAPNLPFGISFTAERFSEAKLVGFAYAFEQRTRVRATVAPYLAPTTELVDVVVARREREKFRLWM